MGGSAVIVPADLAAKVARSASVDVSDLTAAQRTDEAPYWCDDGRLVLPFDPEPTDAEQHLIIRRLLTATPDEEAWVGQVVDAYDTGDDSALLRLLAQDRLGPLLGT